MQLLSRPEVAKLLRMSTKTLDRLVAAGEGPPVTRIGGRVLFRQDQLDAWIKARSADAGEPR
jgi:excisionase family DNA binding protein